MREARDRYWQPNTHLVAALAASGGAGTLVASHDIVDAEGTKLWSRDQPISQALQHKLLERRLVKPLESCLRIADGVTTATLVADLQARIDANDAVAVLVRPHAPVLLAQVEALPLHAVAQLLLSTVRSSRPRAYRHAVAAMAVAGALACGAGWARYDLRLALLGGLLHDVGELYLDPAMVDAPHALSGQAFRHLSVHPSVGAMLLGSQTDYPTVLQRAVAEHHERLDGTGYPLRSHAAAQSGLGRLLAAVEVVAGIAMSGRPAALARAALALRIVPGEFESAWVAALARAAREAAEPVAGVDAAAIDRMGERLAEAVQAVQAAIERPCAPPFARLLQQAGHALGRLAVGWNSAGLWSGGSVGDEPGGCFEASVVVDEVAWRLRTLARHLESAGNALQGADAAALARLCASLDDPTGA